MVVVVDKERKEDISGSRTGGGRDMAGSEEHHDYILNDISKMASEELSIRILFDLAFSGLSHPLDAHTVGYLIINIHLSPHRAP